MSNTTNLRPIPPKFECLGYAVYQDTSGFRAIKGDITLLFTVEGDNGMLTTTLNGIYNKRTNRAYKAWRYLTKYICDIRELGWKAFELNLIWDYGAQIPIKEYRAKHYDKIHSYSIKLGV